MENIALPKKINFQAGDQEHQGVIAVEPLYPGYGMTLGNSLRRVLLSSLPGAAVVGVKIKGANHEFMALSGVKEDVLEIVLNVKQLHVKMFTDEEIRLELRAKGKGKVTAAAITKDSQVEITNPNLVIANLTDDKADLFLEIFVQAGRGYRMSEGVKRQNNEIGFIEIDSIFSPVLAASLKVDNVRVGKMTNWDRLLIDIKTDGTITPEEAFEKSVQILVEQYSALLPGAILPIEAEVVEINEEAEMAQEPSPEVVDEVVDSPADDEDESNIKVVKKDKKETKKKSKK